MAIRIGARLLVGALLVACEGGGVTHAPCDDDVDCPAGRFCRAGVGCDLDCLQDIDCVPMGGGACDTARGRCAATSPMDAGVPDGSTGCTSDPQCDDGAFCNGTETCVGGACRAGNPPCSAAECDEAADSCDACLDPDRDGDGFERVECGGRDCNDDDPRIPRAEVCDEDHVDEDCNPATVGSLILDDADGDGFLSTACCNRDGDELRCGTDCDDTRADVHPDRLEICDGVDNDCDGVIDPGCGCTAGDTTMCGYMPPPSCTPVTGRCTTAGAFDCPGGLVTGAETETCNGLDDNCNGMVDEAVPGIGSACYTGPPATRGRGICRDGAQACVSGAPQCTGQTTPASETCVGVARGRDDDCDGVVDEGLINACGQCTEALPPELCNGVDDNCNGLADETFTCRRGATESRRASCSPYFGIFAINEVRTCGDSCGWSGWVPQYPDTTCNGIDDDCDGRIDEGAVAGSCAQRMFRKNLDTREYLITTNSAEGSPSWTLDSHPTNGAFCLYRAQANVLMVPVRRCYQPSANYHYIRSPSCFSGHSDEGVMGWAWQYTGLPPTALSAVELLQYRNTTTTTRYWFGTSLAERPSGSWSAFPVHESGGALYVVPAGTSICGS